MLVSVCGSKLVTLTLGDTSLLHSLPDRVDPRLISASAYYQPNRHLIVKSTAVKFNYHQDCQFSTGEKLETTTPGFFLNMAIKLSVNIVSSSHLQQEYPRATTAAFNSRSLFMEYLLWICSTAHLVLLSRLCTWPFLYAAYMGLCFLVGFFSSPTQYVGTGRISRLDVCGFFCSIFL